MKGLIENALRSLYDAKLAKLESEQRRSEEVLRAELRGRDAEIEALRAGALSSLSNRQVALFQRRLLAVERLWLAVTERAQLRALAIMTQSVNLTVLVKSAAGTGREGDATRAFAEMLSKVGELDKMPKHQHANAERPFISPVTWAMFTAYNTVLMYPPLMIISAVNKIDPELMKLEPLVKLVKEALPHRGAFIDKHGADGLTFLVEEIEEELLKALDDDLEGKESDEKSVSRAREILKLADAAGTALSAAPVVPPSLRDEKEA